MNLKSMRYLLLFVLICCLCSDCTSSNDDESDASSDTAGTTAGEEEAFPEIQIAQSSGTILPNETFFFSMETSEAIDFEGEIDEITDFWNQTSETAFTVYNAGNADLVINPLVSVSGDNAFSISRQPLKTTIPSGDSTTFIVRYNADTLTSAVQGTIKIPSNDPDNSEFSFELDTGIEKRTMVYPDPIRDYLTGLGTEDASVDYSTPGTPTTTSDSDYDCITQTVEMGKNFNLLYAADPLKGTLYPGMIFDANSLVDGTYAVLRVDPMGSLTMTADYTVASEGSKRVTIDVQEPAYSSVTEAINTLMTQNGVNYSVKPSTTFDKIEVYESDQMSFALQAGGSYAFAEVAGGFDFSDNTIRSRVVIRFMQVSHTISVDTPDSPSKFFTPTTEVEDLEPNFDDTHPMFVSSITYGRIVFMAVESTKSTSEIKAFFQAAYDAASTSADISSDMSWNEVKNSSSIEVTAMGGKLASQGGLISQEGFSNYVADITDEELITTSVPLSYRLRVLSERNFPMGNIFLTTTYKKKNCVAVVNSIHEYKIRFYNIRVEDFHDGPGNEVELYGTLDVNGYQTASSKRLWNQPYNYALSVKKDKCIRNILTNCPSLNALGSISSSINRGQNIDSVTLKYDTEKYPDCLDEGYIKVDGDMWEDDGSSKGTLGDDHYHFEPKRIWLKDINPTVENFYYHPYGNNKDKLWVLFSIEKLPQ